MLTIHPCYARDILLRNTTNLTGYVAKCREMVDSFSRSGMRMGCPVGQMNLDKIYRYPPEERVMRAVQLIRGQFNRMDSEPGLVPQYGAYILNLEDKTSGDNLHAAQYWNSTPDTSWSNSLSAARSRVLYEMTTRNIAGTEFGGISNCFVTAYYFLYSTNKGNYSVVNDVHEWLFRQYGHGNPSLYIRETKAMEEIWQRTMWHAKESMRLNLPCVPSVRLVYKDSKKEISPQHWQEYFKAFEYCGIDHILLWIDGYDSQELPGIETMKNAYKSFYSN